MLPTFLTSCEVLYSTGTPAGHWGLEAPEGPLKALRAPRRRPQEVVHVIFISGTIMCSTITYRNVVYYVIVQHNKHRIQCMDLRRTAGQTEANALLNP